MNPDQLKKHLNAVQIQIKTFAKKDAPRIAGKVAIDHHHFRLALFCSS